MKSIEIPLSREKFLNEYYEKAPLLFKVDLPFSMNYSDAVARSLFGWDVSDNRIQMYLDGLIKPEEYVETTIDIGRQKTSIVRSKFYDYLKRGASLVLNRIQNESPELNDLGMSFGQFVGEQFNINAYYSVGGGGTFGIHWDTHDVFAVQLEGRKKWRVFAPTFKHPLGFQRSKNFPDHSPGECVFEHTMERGDVMYLSSSSQSYRLYELGLSRDTSFYRGRSKINEQPI